MPLDLTFLTDDITLNNNITGVAYEEDPDSHIWMPTENGSVLGCTYDFTTRRLGWHKHSYFGDIVDICSVKQNGTNQTWMLVDNGSGLDVVKVGTEYLDHYSTQTTTSATAVSAIGPFAQLANEEVHVLTDGANDNKITLDSSGNGTTNTPGFDFVVGKSYDEAYIESLNLDIGAPRGSGASKQKRWNKLFVHISQSAKPLIDGKRPPTRSSSTLMGQVEELKTEFVQVTTRGWDREGSVRISQDLPFKTTILAFLGQMEQS